MFRVNRQTDYAIRVLLFLAGQAPGERLTSLRIRQEMLIPGAFLGRIVARLAEAGLLKTFPGREGGLELGRPAETITLKDVVELMEGPMLIFECMNGGEACPFEDDCRVRLRWHGLQSVILAELERCDLASLAKEAKSHSH